MAGDENGSSSASTRPERSPSNSPTSAPDGAHGSGNSNGNGAENGATAAANKPETGPKAKRRKVSRACVYCRRSHMTCDNNRPCMRCIKRDIGHWCRDEPREPSKRKSGTFPESNGHTISEPPGLDGSQQLNGSPLAPHNGSKEVAIQDETKPGQVPTIKAPVPISNQTASTMPDWIPGLQNQYHDMHSLHSSIMFNAPEVVSEYALLNDFLNPGSLEDGLFGGEDGEATMFGGSLFGTGNATPNMPPQQGQPGQSNLMLPPGAVDGNNITRPASVAPNDKSKETYYLTAADPAGNDTAEKRINELLQAKFKAGLLKPFNYITGYTRLGKYMEKHMQPQNRQKILRQLDKYRPKFRVRMEHLSDVELIKVEMWFERCLMEYDRVFASMAIPACCWRRTGEIYRGNKELAELIDVPVEQLRDGKLLLYDIMGEADFAGYWELFGSIAFDKERKGMLTRCSLKNPEQHSQEAGIACCFSFTIRKDDHDIPSLIVGNFLPIKAR